MTAEANLEILSQSDGKVAFNKADSDATSHLLLAEATGHDSLTAMRPDSWTADNSLMLIASQVGNPALSIAAGAAYGNRQELFSAKQSLSPAEWLKVKQPGDFARVSDEALARDVGKGLLGVVPAIAANIALDNTLFKGSRYGTASAFCDTAMTGSALLPLPWYAKSAMMTGLHTIGRAIDKYSNPQS